ncbi:MAG TPA: assimilatory sulfite reductase (NADPH) flavoprotein subunit [Steroidobacteraceae bacterium]|nr:assimilatory sulfite reductase (NADPH) flavoprotein subunit [Steroidobacteraceae bacterium]
MPNAWERDEWAQAPFDSATTDRLRSLITAFDVGQRLWLSGFLAGSTAPVGANAPASQPATAQRSVATILYGSQSGNSERVARLLHDKLKERQIESTLLDMMDCKKSHLQSAQKLIVIVSTHGDGEPPERALPLHELLHGPKIPRLENLSYCVLALGDSSYEKFCETGRQFDARLEALGAKRIRPREECDVEFEMPARRWIDDVLTHIGAQPGADVPARSADADPRTATVSTAHTRRNPFNAAILVNQRLTGRDSSKDVRHIELSLEGSHIRYEPGDAIGVVPRNRADAVDELLGGSQFNPEAAVRIDSQTVALRQALLDHFEIGPVNPALLQRYAAAVGSTRLTQVCASPQETRRYLRGRHLVDLLREHPPTGLGPAEFAQLLRPLAPRLYSIASSQRAAMDEAHLTVSLVEYESFNAQRRGVVSSLLAGLDAGGATAPIYLHRNAGFRLPPDPRTPIIMIGPGTGVAPFRAFVAEREVTGAAGRNWLFFGDRNFGSDFLYHSEWLDARKRGVLTRIDVAFSRDQADKIYVQDRLRENGAAIWAWLQEGAHFYVCGDAERMAHDVHAALLDIARTHGALTDEAAVDYVTAMQRDRRYQKDVY